MAYEDWNDGKTSPTDPGWYAIQICWDIEEGIHIFVVEFPSEAWETYKSHEPPWNGPHPTKEAAREWGYANDPEGPL